MGLTANAFFTGNSRVLSNEVKRVVPQQPKEVEVEVVRNYKEDDQDPFLFLNLVNKWQNKNNGVKRGE